MDEDLALAGIAPPPKVNEAGRDDFVLWEENWESLSWFLRMNRRWIFNPSNGRRIRIDDQAVLAQFKIFGVKKSKRKVVMDDLLAMEAAALEVLNREQ